MVVLTFTILEGSFGRLLDPFSLDPRPASMSDQGRLRKVDVFVGKHVQAHRVSKILLRLQMIDSTMRQLHAGFRLKRYDGTGSAT